MSTEQDGVAALERMIRGELSAVIFEAGAFYVQFALDGPDALCEAVGDEYLDGRLTPNQLRLLFDLGFRPSGRGGSGNHAMKRAAEPAGLARLAFETLVTVYGAAGSDITVAEV